MNEEVNAADVLGLKIFNTAQRTVTGIEVSHGDDQERAAEDYEK